jgi:hypothetical protein
LGISNTNLQSQILALKKVIGISNTNWYFECRLVLQIPIVTSKNQLLLQIPIVTSNTNRVKIQEEEEEEEEEQQSGY